jgi:hypothetical protein
MKRILIFEADDQRASMYERNLLHSHQAKQIEIEILRARNSLEAKSIVDHDEIDEVCVAGSMRTMPEARPLLERRKS